MQVGDKVIWTPKGHSYHSDNIGEIVEVVEPYERINQKELAERYNCKIMFYQQLKDSRPSISYLVLCPPVFEHHRAKNRLYWPRTDSLRKYEDE